MLPTTGITTELLGVGLTSIDYDRVNSPDYMSEPIDLEERQLSNELPPKRT